MRITHICLIGAVTDLWNYQDNLLTKYHKKLGHDVTIVTSQWIWSSNGKMVKDNRDKYVNSDGVTVIRLPIANKDSLDNRFKKYKNLYSTLEECNPQILFVHGSAFLDVSVLVKYLKKHKEVTVYVDNHADFLNSATNWLSKNILHKIIWKHYANKLEPYVKRFYGVLPARVDFLTDVYGLPAEKCELLVMGADDEEVKRTKESGIGTQIRKQYDVADDDVLIMTGGKLNQYRPEVLNLLEAVHEMNHPKIKVLFFGVVDEQYKQKFDALVAAGGIIDVGWLTASKTYDYMAASDLLVFPGLHSVLWEQAVGSGKPCLFRKMDGFTHIDMSGNCILMDDVSKDGIKATLNDVLQNNRLPEMTKRAEEIASNFSYMEIAKRAIEAE